ncbi:MAG: hydantoinase B/oxoprolinase family protein, partial [Alphaproteobacteria bacterium]
YDGNLPHVPDMAVIAPIFYDGTRVGFAGSIAHKADFGGIVPGSAYGQATEYFQEGIVFPPVRLYRAGVYNPDLERLIAANSRQPELVLGDLRGQIGACRIGGDRMQALCADYGADGIRDILSAMIEASGIEFRAALRHLPDGVHEAEAFLDNDGIDRERTVRLHVRITVKHGEVEFDFTGTDPQGKGPVNLRSALLEACCFQALIGLLDPDLAYSDAARDAVHIRTILGTVVDATPPSGGSNYMKTCTSVIDMLLEALGPFKPERGAAFSGGSYGMAINWQAQSRRPRGNQYEIFGSAYGGCSGQDGASGVAVHLSNLFITPVEIIETEFPCRITRFELVPGSGGAGEFRGGLAFRRDYELLEPAMVVFRGERARVPPKGVAGGAPGRAGRFVLHPDTADEVELPIVCRVDVEAGARLRVEVAGGGGYGDPARRAADALERDAREGYVVLD